MTKQTMSNSFVKRSTRPDSRPNLIRRKSNVGCCSTTKDGSCSHPTGDLEVCPSCGQKGKPVAVLTVKSLVRDHTRVPASASYSFCRTVDCEVVYFLRSSRVAKTGCEGTSGNQGEGGIQFRSAIASTTAAKTSAGISRSPAKPRCWKRLKAECKAVFCACELKNRAELAAWATLRAVFRKRRNVRRRRFLHLVELPLPVDPRVRSGPRERSSHEKAIRSHCNWTGLGSFDRRPRVPFCWMGRRHH